MTIKIHPAAECVRLMDEEELASLVADLKTNGLIDPLVMGRVNGAESDALVDGRNRLRACEIAGVVPRYITQEFADDDAVRAFVKSKTEHRNLTKGQMAMRLALLYPEPDKPGRGKKGKATETVGFSQQRLREARQVLAHSRDLALAVRDGTVPLDAALERVNADRSALETTEAKVARLRIEAPDLADLVAEGRLQIDAAIAVLDERKRTIARDIEHGKQAAQMGMSRFLADVGSILLAARLTDEKLLDKARLDAVIKAAHQLESVVLKEEESNG